MARILSQEEIDALLSTAAEAQPAPRVPVATPEQMIRYNFRRPERLSKDQIHSLHFLHDRFARSIATSLSAYLRTVTEMSVVSVEQFSYSEFLMSLNDPTAFYALSMAPFDDLGALEIHPNVAFTMIDRMLGGAGKTVALTRALTEIEQNVVDAVVKILLEGLTEVWKPIIDFTFGIRGRDTRPQMLQVAALNEVVVMIVFDAKVGDARGTINFCMPTSVVEAASLRFSHTWRKQRRDLTTEEAGWMRENLQRVTVPVVPLIETRLRIADILGLHCGDVLSLSLPAHQPIDLRVRGTRKLTGRFVVEGGRLCTRVEQRCAPVTMSGETRQE